MDLKALEKDILDVTVDTFMSVIAEGVQLRKFNGVVIHHSYYPDKPLWGRDYARIFNQTQKYACGWSNGLGNHFVITHNPDNPKEIRIQCSSRWVRQIPASHTLNRKGIKLTEGGEAKAVKPNESMIGICFVGNYDINTLPPETYLAAKPFVDVLLRNANIPRENIFGHYTFDFKSCPGRRFDVSFFRR
jgi:hypothetical protein